MMEDLSKPYEIYDKIQKNIRSCGIFHKCLFHLHTPESYDYKYFNSYDDKASQKSIEKEVSESVLLQRVLSTGIFPKDRKTDFLDKYSKYYAEGKFKNKREFWAFLLIADQLYRNRIELIVISDHNTINGYDKLCNVIKILHEENHLGLASDKIYPTVVLGIELSCADKNHVVGIFNDIDEKTKEDSKNKIKSFLEEFLMNEEEGLYITSNQVIDEIFKMGGIAYIAHINTSSIFSDKVKFMTGAYKKHLLENPNFHIVGIKSREDLPKINSLLNSHVPKEFAIVIDSDAHNIDDIQKGYFWIKGQKCNFNMIQSALLDSKITISLEQPRSRKIFIEGLWVKGKEGFLNGGDINKEFVLTFSDSLNCLIGGRGVGKSTVINIFDMVLSQRFKEINTYEVLSNYNEIWLLCKLEDTEYLILFAPLLKKYESDTHTKNAIEYLRPSYGKKAYELEKKIKNGYEEARRILGKLLLDKGITIYQVSEHEKFPTILTEKKKRNLLQKIFGEGYVTSELIQIAKSDKINNYIIETMNLEKKLRYKRFLRIKDNNGLLKFFDEHDKILSERKKEIVKCLEDFNNQPPQKDKLRIVYEQCTNLYDFIDFEEILIHSNKFDFWYKKDSYLKQGQQYNITLSGILGFLNQCCVTFGLIKFWKAIFNKQYDAIAGISPIEKYCEDWTNEMAENNFLNIKDNKVIQMKIIKLIVNEIIKLGSMIIINKFSTEYIDSIEKFTLEFNIESKATNVPNPKPHFMEIKKLSHGQKTVAMLSFILGYSSYIGDERPLIIDQPEDNLDNRYIYENLVKIIRDVKNKKQIIIATHNATIVTNTRAEQVIVLESDNQHGKLLAQGYSDEKKIKKHIINQLEGGIEAFKQKCLIYADIIKSTT